MSVHRTLGRLLTRPIAYAGACFLSGCGSVNLSSITGGQRSATSLSTVDLTAANTYQESADNNAFDKAEQLVWEGEPLGVEGAVQSESDVDVYDLGPMAAGDRIMAELTTSDTLDGVIGLFDGDGSSLLINDHRNVYMGRRDPFVDVVAREASTHCYLAVAATPGYQANGTYTLVATKELGDPIPSKSPATFLLVFSGGQSVRIGSRPAIDVPPFDAADIGPEYDGLTDYLIDAVVAKVREDFAPFDVTILSTSEGAQFESGMSRLFFGTYDPALLGVAEGVDEFNSDQQQEAIVFTDTFSVFERVSPTTDEMAQALANVSSHEIGHLLGLVHTADPGGIMDVTASLSEILADQAFTRSPIYDLVFPIGDQDAVTYLVDTVGGDYDLAVAAEQNARRTRAKQRFEPNAEPARGKIPFSSCALECGLAGRDTPARN